MSDTDRYLSDLLSEAKDIRRLLESIKNYLREIDAIKDEVDDIKRTLERRR